MKYFIFLTAALASQAFAQSSVYLYSDYYGTLEKMRQDWAVKRDGCKPTVKARKIYVDKSNELREIAYWDEKGKFEESHPENWGLRAKVEEVFAKGQAGADPCEKKEALSPTASPKATKQ